jgi:hypothetical protein
MVYAWVTAVKSVTARFSVWLVRSATDVYDRAVMGRLPLNLRRNGRMPRKDESQSRTAPVRIDVGLAKKAKIAAEHQGLDVSEYLSGLLKAPVEKDWAKARKAILDA